MKQWFETTEQYTDPDPLGSYDWGESLALTRVLEDQNGELKTQSGWGQTRFMENFQRGKFKPARILSEFKAGYPFGIIMRSVPAICCDIDGKNGGIQASSILRLPETKAEASKSGNGYHLFYSVPESLWDPEKGFADFPDANGLIPGVDIRSVGIVYHYSQQRWNNLDMAPLPRTLRKLLEQKKVTKELALAYKGTDLSGEDLAIAQEQILERLAKPIPAGRRNQSLYAIGCGLFKYNVKGWPDLLRARGDQLGMDQREMTGIINHIQRYS
jgi:hypothetical protein